MVTARPAATGAANPQMPAPSANEPSTDTHTPAGTAAPTTDIYDKRRKSSPDLWMLRLPCSQSRERCMWYIVIKHYRRLAELSFRGVAFCQLPREVMKDVCHDFDNICSEMAKRLASLFAFLKPASTNAKHSDPMGQLLYADPGYWLYGLLSFCAKACESKTAEANGAPVLRAKDERGARA